MESIGPQILETLSNLSRFVENLDKRVGSMEKGVAENSQVEVSNQNLDSEEEPPNIWAELPTSTIEATKNSAVQIISRLAVSPTSEQISILRKDICRFKGVPQTPISTRKFEDKKLFRLQTLVEDCLHVGVQCWEDPEHNAMHVGRMMALLRRTFEEISDQRRHVFARGATHVLERAEEHPHLLTKDEEKALATARRSRSRQRPRRNPSSSSFPRFEMNDVFENNNMPPFPPRNTSRQPFRRGGRGRGRFGGRGRTSRSNSR